MPIIMNHAPHSKNIRLKYFRLGRVLTKMTIFMRRNFGAIIMVIVHFSLLYEGMTLEFY